MNRMFRFVRINKAFTGIIFLYVFVMLSVIHWGIPNVSHPFTYHMDEWHQLQSVKAIFKYGTPNVPGAAHGPMFQFLLSGIYLAPFTVLGIINPFIIKSALDFLPMQEKIFELLRLNTLIFGVLSLFVLRKIAKDYLKINSFIPTLLLTATPIWLSLSNYFKYDIALIFWILLSIMLILKYGKYPSLRNFIFASISCALALATKISALPLVLIYIFSFFWFTPKVQRKYLNLFLGLMVILVIFVFVGIPDLLFRRGDYYEFFYSNLISVPKASSNLILGMPYWLFLLTNQFPTIFGHFFFLLFSLAIIFWALRFVKASRKKRDLYRIEFFIFVAFVIFASSLAPLKLFATGNRALVLLPFFALLSGLALRRILQALSGMSRKFIIVLLVIGIAIQAFESYSWIAIKQGVDPRASSSSWIQKHLKEGAIIGIENVPIYQMLPDIIIKEYYSKQYNPLTKTKFQYEAVDSSTKRLPLVVIITNQEISTNHLKKSPKKDLVNRLKKEEYRQIVKFEPYWNFYKIFGDELNFFVSGIVPTSTITIFTKQ